MRVTFKRVKEAEAFPPEDESESITLANSLKDTIELMKYILRKVRNYADEIATYSSRYKKTIDKNFDPDFDLTNSIHGGLQEIHDSVNKVLESCYIMLHQELGIQEEV
jgi:hypothetical protein